jgi:hypothetical protein
MKADPTFSLNRQLEAYAAVAKLPERYSPKRWKSWAIYAAATGAALAGASAASAEIIYSGLQNISTFHSGYSARDLFFFIPNPGIELDGNNDFLGIGGSHAFNPEERFFENFDGHASAGAGGTGGRKGGLFTTGKGSVKNFAFGAPISGIQGLRGGGVLFSESVAINRNCSNGFALCNSTTGVTKKTRGQFTPNFTGILGVEFNRITSRGKAFAREYGWVRLRVSGGSDGVPFGTGVNIPNAVTVIDWAYNTDGTILAGELAGGTEGPPFVPEPSTMPVMLLAAGAAGVLEWKRRRKLAAKA